MWRPQRGLSDRQEMLLELALIKVGISLLRLTPQYTDFTTFSFTTELISSVPSWNPTLLARNFTDAEIAYCQSQPPPPVSFAARWVCKEAVFKSLGVASKGAAAPMKDIEILPAGDSGSHEETLYGDAKKEAAAKGVKKVLISLSHSEVSFLWYLCSQRHGCCMAIVDCYNRFRSSYRVGRDILIRLLNSCT
jgi:phosphopantetheine--protein transferase-like protein